MLLRGKEFVHDEVEAMTSKKTSEVNDSSKSSDVTALDAEMLAEVERVFGTNAKDAVATWEESRKRRSSALLENVFGSVEKNKGKPHRTYGRGSRQRDEETYKTHFLKRELEGRGLPAAGRFELAEVWKAIEEEFGSTTFPESASPALAALIVSTAEYGASFVDKAFNDRLTNFMLSWSNLTDDGSLEKEISSLRKQGIAEEQLGRLCRIFSDHAESPKAREGSISEKRERLLPKSAPEVWAQRKGRKENAIEFLRRVWGEFMDQGILYQDDIKRLGDPKLVQAVRDRCIAEGIDASTVLPPPGSERWERIAGHLSDEEIEAAYRLGLKRYMRERRT